MMATGTADKAAAIPRLRDWGPAGAFGPVVMGWVFGAGALASAIGVPVWIAAMAGLEITAAAALGALLLTRSGAMVTWWAGATGCTTGWVAFAVAVGPWTWTGEISLVVPATFVTLLWPVALSAKRSHRAPAGPPQRIITVHR
jgi:hypothetical protein